MRIAPTIRDKRLKTIDSKPCVLMLIHHFCGGAPEWSGWQSQRPARLLKLRFQLPELLLVHRNRRFDSGRFGFSDRRRWSGRHSVYYSGGSERKSWRRLGKNARHLKNVLTGEQVKTGARKDLLFCRPAHGFLPIGRKSLLFTGAGPSAGGGHTRSVAGT